MKLSKFFAVATEGDTTDGRAITAAQIREMAETYNPKTYGARVWLEHFRGIFHDGPFKAYGDVTALKAEEVDGKLKLFAQILPTEDLVQINKERQKVYSSIEMAPNFAKTGKTYLMGLGVTDSPASLGTDMLQFSQNAESSPLAARKQAPDNLFSAAQEVSLQFEEQEMPDPEPEKFLDKVKALLAGNNKKTKAELHAADADIKQAVEAIATAQHSAMEKLHELEAIGVSNMKERIDQFAAALEKLDQDVADLTEEFNTQPANPSTRRPANGSGGDRVKTDC